MKSKLFKVALFSLFAFVVTGCGGSPIATDSNNPPPMDQVASGSASIGLMMNVINTVTGNLVKSKMNININFGMSCISDRFSLELKSKNKTVFYREVILAQQSKIEANVTEGNYELVLTKKADPKYIVKTDVRINAEQREYSITACN